ncbi:sensor histidine kinase [Enterococcus sp. JM9B]|uniref:sensor histidine kinase n=1 Tax=Enterococcus sp. JM9B TaxID=1857216 RepID=UPI0013752C52|nr:histidine kinase [Enterococcus sp. JM9B]
MIKRIATYYSNLSYQGKLKSIFNIILFLVGITILFIGIMFSRIMMKEIYDRNQEKLSILSANVKQELESVEQVTTEIHQNGIIQNNLLKVNDPSLSAIEKTKFETAIRKEFSWLLANKRNIKSMILLDSEDQRIIGEHINEKNFFQDYSFSQILATIPENSKKGRWFFDKGLQEGLFSQTLYTTRSGVLKKAGTILLFVNTTFIQDFLENSGIFSDKDFFVMELDKTFYTTNLSNYDEYINFIKENKMADSATNAYEIDTIDRIKYYVYADAVSLSNNDFHFYYFLMNQQVIQKAIQIEIVFFFVMSLMLFTGFRLVNYFIRKVITPINELAENMKKFEGEADLEKLRSLDTTALSMKRTDEIGILYHSFQELIKEIETLVIKDYQSKLLTQEMEYKFLQAQLDPHFLYNTLNSINYLALNKGDLEVSEMVTSLALLFRKKISNPNDFNTVQEELDVIQAYISIQAIRFKSRLIFEMNISQDVRGLSIPVLSIQPVVENAIKYGVEKLSRPVTVNLSIFTEGEDLVIRVTDNGLGFEATLSEASDSSRLGLKNIQSRLKVIYGEKANLKITSIPNIKTEVTIMIPLLDQEQGE